jgi:hypothetical protein
VLQKLANSLEMLNDVLVIGGCLVGDCEELGLGSTIIGARPIWEGKSRI